MDGVSLRAITWQPWKTSKDSLEEALWLTALFIFLSCVSSSGCFYFPPSVCRSSFLPSSLHFVVLFSLMLFLCLLLTILSLFMISLAFFSIILCFLPFFSPSFPSNLSSLWLTSSFPLTSVSPHHRLLFSVLIHHFTFLSQPFFILPHPFLYFPSLLPLFRARFCFVLQ